MKRKPLSINKHTKWDKKSTIYVTVAIIAIAALWALMAVIAGYLRNSQMEKYKGMTFGEVLSIKATTTQSQDFDGAHTLTPFYTVYFIYKVNGKKFGNSNNISNSGRYKLFIRELYRSDFKKSILIRYKLTNPQESIIVVE